MSIEIGKVIEGVRSVFSVIKDMKTTRDFEGKLLPLYKDFDTFMYGDNREYLDEQLRILVRTKNQNAISEDDFDVLDDQARSLLPEDIKKNIVEEDEY